MGLFSKIGSAITGAVGGFLTGGPAGALIGGAAGLFGGGAPSIPQPLPVSFSKVRSTVGAVGAAGGAVGQAIVPAPGVIKTPMAGVPGPPLTFGAAAEMSPLARINEVLKLAGRRRVTVQMLMESARVCGLDQTASMLGVDVRLVCAAIVMRRRRRARGISAADLRRTRSTIRKINSMASQLSQLCAPARRRAAPRRR